MKKREKMLMGVAAAVLVYFLVNQFLCGNPPETVQAVDAKTPETAVSSAPAQTPPAKKAPVSRKKMVRDRLQFASWGRDPFADTYRLAPPDSQSAASDFVLRGVISKGSQAHVLIGDEILKEGDQVGDLKILDIDKNRVVCKKKGKIITLILRDENE